MERSFLTAVGLMLIAMSLIPAGDTAGKLLTTQHGVSASFVAWSRFALGACLVLPILGQWPRWALFRDWRIWLRGALISGGILSILTALKTEDVATVFGAFFVGPVLSYVLSTVFLGERATWARSLLLALGFCGVLLVVKPGFGMTPGLGFAVLAGAFYGSYLTASRWLSAVAAPRQMVMTQLVIGAVLLAPLGLPAMPQITAPIAGLTLASAAASGLGNLLLIVAYGRVGASVLAPLVYFQLIAATGFGWWIFGSFPDTWAIIGLALLVTSGFATLLLRR